VNQSHFSDSLMTARCFLFSSVEN